MSKIVGAGLVVSISSTSNNGSGSDLTKVELVATPDQQVFTIPGAPDELKMVFEEQAFTKGYIYAGGTLTMNDPLIGGTTLTVYH